MPCARSPVRSFASSQARHATTATSRAIFSSRFESRLSFLFFRHSLFFLFFFYKRENDALVNRPVKKHLRIIIKSRSTEVKAVLQAIVSHQQSLILPCRLSHTCERYDFASVKSILHFQNSKKERLEFSSELSSEEF